MVQWLIIILVYNFAILKLSCGEVTLAIRLLHYINRNGLTYENRPCDTRLEYDINRDGRCDTGFLFCLVRLPFQNPHNCTLGDHFTGFVGADDIYFVNNDRRHDSSALPVQKKKQRSSLISLWFQPTIYFRFPYPKTGIGLIVEVFDIDDTHNQTIHDSIDFYGRTLLDLKLDRSVDAAQNQRIYLRSLFGTYTNLTADFSLYCSPNYHGVDCETFCLPNGQRYDCDATTGQKLCKNGYFGQDCLSDVRACEDQPCSNNGTCVVYLRRFLCQCQIGFEGRSCEINSTIKIINQMCNRTTCVHGECSSDGKCACHDGWTAENCNQRLTTRLSACASRPCLHNSTCQSVPNIDPLSAYRCHCRAGYTGRNCEVAIVTACERTPCLHGQCLKIDVYTEICICEDNWSGIDCSRALPTRSTSTATALPFSTSTAQTMRPSIRSIQPIVTTQSSRNLTYTTFKSDVYDYLSWLNGNTELNQVTSANPVITTETTPPLQPYSACLSAPCLHNSTCVVRSKHSFQCICSPSFIGVYCEIEILHIAHFQKNPCENSPCQHQSVCITTSNHEPRCVCRAHYTGRYCENPPPFHSKPSKPRCTRNCQNGGTCLIDESKQEQCKCKDSHTGLFCELTKNSCNDSSCHNDPCFSNPCLSNGTCHAIPSSSNYTCSCSQSSTGRRCESSSNADSPSSVSREFAWNDDDNLQRDHSTELWPLAIVFGYVFSLMLVFIIIWFLWYGLSIRPRSSYRSDIPYGDRSEDYYQPYRLGVSNPLFFSNQEHHPSQLFKTFAN